MCSRAPAVNGAHTWTQSDGFELPFDLNDSVFRPRAKECASKDYYDTSIYSRTCQIDWKRMCAKSRVQKLFGKVGVDATKQRAMEEAVVAQYSMLSGIFDYYGTCALQLQHCGCNRALQRPLVVVSLIPSPSP